MTGGRRASRTRGWLGRRAGRPGPAAFGDLSDGWMLVVEHDPQGDVVTAHGYIDPPGTRPVVRSDGRRGPLAGLVPSGWVLVDVLLELTPRPDHYVRVYVLRRPDVRVHLEAFVGRRWQVLDGRLTEDDGSDG